MKIKICGLSRLEDIWAVNEAKPDWCGFVIHFPQSHRNVTPEQVRELRAHLAPGIVPVGVFVNQPLEQAAALLNDGTISIAQLHGQEGDQYIAALRSLAPGAEIWKAFRIASEQDVIHACQSTADLVLLDNGQGTGRMFDWNLMNGISIKRPFLLAGGLDPQAIPQAAAFHPYGVDLSSGVETDRKKDLQKILAAVRAARKE